MGRTAREDTVPVIPNERRWQDRQRTDDEMSETVESSLAHRNTEEVGRARAWGPCRSCGGPLRRVCLTLVIGHRGRCTFKGTNSLSPAARAIQLSTSPHLTGCRQSLRNCPFSFKASHIARQTDVGGRNALKRSLALTRLPRPLCRLPMPLRLQQPRLALQIDARNLGIIRVILPVSTAASNGWRRY